MKRLMTTLLLLGACLAMAQTPGEAVNILENGDGAGVRALSMGRAFEGVSDDFSALFYNPAGLALLKHSSVGGGFRLMQFENEATFQENTEKSNENTSAFSSAAFAYKFPAVRGGMGLAVGYHRVKDFDDFLYFSGFNTASNGLWFELDDDNGASADYDFDRDVQQTEEVNNRGGMGALSIGLGALVSPNLALGVTFSRYTGSSQYDLSFYQDDVDGLYNMYPADIDAYESYETIDTDYSGWGTKLGAMLMLNPDIRIGVAVDLPTTVRVEEGWSAEDVIVFDNGDESWSDLESGEWMYDVRFPAQFSGGAAFNLRALVLSASVKYCDWSSVEFGVPDEVAMTGDYGDLLADNRFFNTDFRPTLAWGVGGELRMPGSGFMLRGGYHVNPSPLKDADTALDRKTLSAGLGLRLDAMTTIDIGFTRTNYDRFSSDALTPGGTAESIKIDKIMAGLTLRLPN